MATKTKAQVLREALHRLVDELPERELPSANGSWSTCATYETSWWAS